MVETRKIAAILAADVVGFSRMTGADEDRTLARLRALRSDLIDPTIAVHNGRVFKRTGDGILVEFRSVVDAVRCSVELQNGMIERNAGCRPSAASNFESASIWATCRGKRRRSHGRRRQYRGATGRRRKARRDLSFRGRLSPSESAARSCGQRSRPQQLKKSSSRSGSIRCKSAFSPKPSPRRRRSPPRPSP